MRRAPGPEASRSAGTGSQAMRVVLARLLAAGVVLRGIGGTGFGEGAELSEDSMRRTFLAAGLWDAQLVITEDNMQGEAVVLCYLQAQHGACEDGEIAAPRNMLFSCQHSRLKRCEKQPNTHAQHPPCLEVPPRTVVG